MKKRLLGILLSMAMVASLVVGCGGSGDSQTTEEATTEESGEQEIDTDATLVIPVAGDIATLNALQQYTRDEGEVMLVGSVFDKWYSVKEDGSIDYYLAENVEMNEDSTELTVTIAKDAKWHDGEDVTTEDVVFTFDALQSGKFTASLSGSTAINGEPIEITAVDEKTFTLTLPEPSASYMIKFSSFFILPEHLFADEADMDTSEINNLGIGYGPYKVVEHVAGEKLVLERNEDYHRGTPNFKTIEYKVIPDSASQELALQNGEINYYKTADLTTLETYQNDENYNVFISSEGRINYAGLNMNSPITSDVRAREAIVKALDIEAIVEGAYGSEDIATACVGGVVCAGGAYYNPDLENFERDLEGAKAIAEEIGLTDITLIYNSARAGMENIALMIQQQCKEAGINVTLNGLDSSAFFKQFTSGYSEDWEIGLNGYSSAGYPQYAKSMYTTDGYYNYNMYVTEEIDQLWVDADTLPTEEERQQAYNDLFVALQEVYSFVPISSTNNVIITQNDYFGFTQGAKALDDLLDIYKVK